MNTIGYMLILGAVFVIGAAIRGRASHLTEDISDGFLALVRGDTDAFGEVIARKGEDTTADQADLSLADVNSIGQVAGDAVSSAGAIAAGGLLAAAVRRGKAAKGYRLTATGPDWYDCSGLMWKACQDIGVYKGFRFTTFNVGNLSAFVKVTDPQVGDMVVWKTHHMGVVSGKDMFYSARSINSGIGYSHIKGFRPEAPSFYLRPKNPTSNNTATEGTNPR